MIRLSSVSKSYGSVIALSEFTLEAKPGEVTGLLGPNSSGKSTALAIAAGLVRPDSGSVERKDGDRKDPLFGYVPQRPAFPTRLSAGEAVNYHARLRSCTHEDAAAACEAAGFPAELLNRRCGELSGGMVQRMSIAVALTGNPPVMIFDEASANLDPEASLQFRKLVAALRDRGCSVLMATHELSLIAEVADRVCILVGGIQVAQLSGDELRSRITDHRGLLAAEHVYMEYTGAGCA